MCRETENLKNQQVVRRKSWKMDSGRRRGFGLSRFSIVAASGLALAGTVPALATIDNAAVASGKYGEQLVQTDAAVLRLDVEPARPEFTVAQSAVLDMSGGEDAEHADGGDTLALTVSVTNTGNVMLSGVAPTSVTVLADGAAGAGELAQASPTGRDIAPGSTEVFELVYRLSAVDVYRAAGVDNGISVTVAATGEGSAGGSISGDATASVTVTANPRLEIGKTAEVTKAAGNRGDDIEAGDLVTYSYTVTNTGNVAINGITIADEHEGTVLNSAEVTSAEDGPFGETESVADPLGVSADDSGSNGVWDVLGAGGAVTFTYRHTVTQAEFEAQ